LGEIAKIHVYDQEYALRVSSESGAERLARVSDLVDRKMKEVAARYVNLTAKNVAVLAALNLADDYIEIQERLVSDQESDAMYAGYEACLPAYIEKIETYLDTKEH